MNINGYNIAAELIDFIIVCSLLYTCVATKPNRTRIFKVVFYGLILSAVNIVTHCIVAIFSISLWAVNSSWYQVALFLYYSTYLFILILIFAYIHMLTLNQREHIENLYAAIFMFAVAYTIGVGWVHSSGGYITVVDGTPQLTLLFYVNLVFAIVDVVLAAISVIVNRSGIPKIIIGYLAVYIPFEAAFLALQILQPRTVILSITYVMPFLMYYIFFHVNRYDEVTGCQGENAFYSHYSEMVKKKGRYGLIFLKFPRLEYVENDEVIKKMRSLISRQCRTLEKKNTSARVYLQNGHTIAIVFSAKNEKVMQDTVAHVHDSLEEVMQNWTLSHMPEYKMVVVGHDQDVKNTDQIICLENFLFEKATKKKVSFYNATDDDLAEAVERYKLEQAIVDIRNKNDLNDPRILVYIQPIYDVKHKNFHSAESLMRLELDGKIFPPDTFIPLAERNGCIHTLTRIILNKVCKKIYDMQDYYVFDAISVNISLFEFMDYDLHEELVSIIEGNGIKCSKIRLELTESMTSDEMEAIAHNMEEFNKAGVSFYLDDFGTGYSNLERIVSLPFKTIKFDKSLLYKSLDDPILLQLIENMVDVFKSHEMIVLVEGVENKAQEMIAQELGFDYIQGYNFSPPIPIEEVGQFFAEKSKRVC